jgi:hypothetical protein
MDEQRRGRGTKNYKRSDERIKEDVNDRLGYDYMLDASDVEVMVTNAEVVLVGTVHSRHDKRRAEDIADSVSGVSNVENRLRIKQGGSSTSTYNQMSSSASTGSTKSSAAAGGSSTGSSGYGSTGYGSSGTTGSTGSSMGTGSSETSGSMDSASTGTSGTGTGSPLGDTGTSSTKSRSKSSGS